MNFWDYEIGGGFQSGSYGKSGTTSTKKVFDQKAIDKAIYDVLSGDQGLAALASAENASGGFASSSKSLLAQDMVAKVVGEIAGVTAETVSTSSETGSSKQKSVKTVICTELLRQGKLDEQLYHAGTSHFLELSPQTVRGYQVWALPVSRKMAHSPRLTAFMQPIATARYEMIVLRKFSILGALTIYLGQPLCWLIGAFVSQESCGETYAHTS